MHNLWRTEPIFFLLVITGGITHAFQLLPTNTLVVVTGTRHSKLIEHIGHHSMPKYYYLSTNPNNSNQKEEEKDDDEEEETQTITHNDLSDGDLLLACRSYLQRRNKLEQWTQAEQRRQQRQKQFQDAKADSNSGFFWDDPTQLKYYRQQTRMVLDDPNIDSTQLQQTLDGTNNQNGLLEQKEQEDTDDTAFYNNAKNRNNDDGEDIIRYTSVVTEPVIVPINPSSSSSKLEQVIFDFNGGQPEENKLEAWSRHFSKFPTQPSESHNKRSASMKKKWQDLEWKAQWYEKRWGNQQQKKNSNPKNPKSMVYNNAEFGEDYDGDDDDEGLSVAMAGRKQQQVKTSSLTPEFLSSEVFTSLTEEEIEHAVEMYVQSKQRRVESRRQTQTRRQEERTNLPDPEKFDANDQDKSSINHETKVPLNALAWDNDPQALEEARRRRSEKAKKAYQTRLEKKKKSLGGKARKVVDTSMDSSSTNSSQQNMKHPTLDNSPQNAIVRIESCLDQGMVPEIRDLEIIAKPIKLRNRKKLLLRLLSEQFGMRGKCVPDDEGRLHFITNCTIDQLVALALEQVH